MNKLFSFISLLIIVTVSVLSVHAQSFDIKGLSEAQKRAAFASLSDADRARLAKELGLVTPGTSEVPLEEPVLVVPATNEGAQIQLVDAAEEVVEDNSDPGLKRFGYDLFAGIPTSFAPATDIPVPQDYILGPGDNVKVVYYGNENQEHSLYISREGVLAVPGLEPIVVSGMSFDRLTQEISDRVSFQKVGVKASVTMGALRSVRIFVLGEANRPGSYTVSSLSTMTNALFLSGGVKEIGSLRNIQLKRNGRTISTLDLYDLLLKGDTRGDRRLQPGDVIFIPTVGDLVSVAGNVKRPAIYEVKKEHHLEDFIKLAGGLQPNAYRDDIVVTRFDANGARSISNVDYATSYGQGYRIKGGDSISVGSLLTDIEGVVSLLGHIKRPGSVSYVPGMRVNDLIGGYENLLDKADLSYALVRREMPPNNLIQVFSFNIGEALRNPGSSFNFELNKQDKVYVFESAVSRDAIISQLTAELRDQATLNNPLQLVSVSGRVKIPGSYPLESGMSVISLLNAAGGLQEAAYQLEAEITRYFLDENYERKVKHIPVDLKRLLEGDYSADIQLKSSDTLFIKETPNWREKNTIEITGEVQFPGAYQIKPGETLGEALKRAGGFTDFAFPDGSIFIRRHLQNKEKQNLLELANRLEKDIALLSVQKETAAVEFGKALLDQMRNMDPAGRFVIDLNAIMANIGDPNLDVLLMDGDRLYVPQKTQEVTVMGEVQYPSSHQFDGLSSRNSYIDRSGGYSARADVERVYVIRANGQVVNREYSRWFSRGDFIKMQPGDTVVVPVNVDYTPGLERWRAITQILGQIGLFAASAKTVGIL